MEISIETPPTSGDIEDTQSRGGLEYTNDFGGLGVTGKNWFYSFRLTDFENFSSQILNEFITGFQSNNTGTESPMARITAKWIKGFYNGQPFDSELVIEGRLIASSGGGGDLFAFSIAQGTGVVVETGNPADTTVDLAIEATNEGETVNYYYRINSNAEMTKDSEGWQLAATYDLGDDEGPVYGYPVNKGTTSLRASSLAFPVTIPDIAVNTGKGASVQSNDVAAIVTSGDLEEENGLSDFAPIAPKQGVTLTVNANEMVALRYAFSGADIAISDLALQKIKDDGTYITFATYLNTLEAQDGGWTITTMDAPNTPLAQSTQLDMDTKYYLYLVVKDNGPYDLNSTLGTIYDPTILGVDSSTSESTPASSGGGGGGCNAGFAPAAVILLAPMWFLLRKK